MPLQDLSVGHASTRGGYKSMDQARDEARSISTPSISRPSGEPSPSRTQAAARSIGDTPSQRDFNESSDDRPARRARPNPNTNNDKDLDRRGDSGVITDPNVDVPASGFMDPGTAVWRIGATSLTLGGARHAIIAGSVQTPANEEQDDFQNQIDEQQRVSQQMRASEQTARNAILAGMERARANPTPEGSYQVAESVFVGGAGDNGAYKTDFVSILEDLGVENPRTSDPAITVGPFDADGKLSLGNMVMDAVAVTTMNQDPINEGGISIVPYDPQLSPRHDDQQYNLIGYSWGSAVVANQAIGEASKGVQVDNLVLIGAPLNPSMMDRLNATDGIENVSVINLTEQGDPLSAGMTDLEIISSVPSLMGQMGTSSGHFHYSLAGPVGHERREELGQQLIDLGLK